MDWNDAARKHHAWVERMGWHNKTVLESLALIGSEIGEAMDECMGGEPTESFGSELADIVLRTVDLAVTTGFDVAELMTSTEEPMWRGGSATEDLAEITVDFAKWVNSARKKDLGEEFGAAMGRVLKRTERAARRAGVSLAEEVAAKMRVNEERGTRGRSV